MKKTKFIFSMIVSLILLIGMSNKSNAITISTVGTPSSVDSGSEFSIVIKFDQKVTGFQAYIDYDSSLVTMSAETDDGNLAINPTAGDNRLGVMYAPIGLGISKDTFEIKVKAAEVTEEKIAEFKISDIEISTETSTMGELLDEQNVSVTIKPIAQKPAPEPEQKPTPTNNNTEYNKGSLAKTGESQFILAIIAGLIITTIVIKIKSKKVM